MRHTMRQALGMPTSCHASGYTSHTQTYLHHLSQHTATPCNTLQYPATCCNALHRTRTFYCNTLQHTAMHCNTLQRTATHCNIPQHSTTHCNALQHAAIHCNTQHHKHTCNFLPSFMATSNEVRSTGKASAFLARALRVSKP